MQLSRRLQLLAFLFLALATICAAEETKSTSKRITLIEDAKFTLSFEITEPVHLGREGWLKVVVDVHQPVSWNHAWIGTQVEGGNLPDINFSSFTGYNSGELLPLGRHVLDERFDLYGLALLGAPPQQKVLKVTARPQVTVGGGVEDPFQVSVESVPFEIVLTAPPKESLPALTERLHGFLQQESLTTYEWYYFRSLMRYPPLASTVDREAEAGRIARSIDAGSHSHDVDAYMKRWGGVDDVLNEAIGQVLVRPDPSMGVNILRRRPALNVPRHLPALRQAATYFSKIQQQFMLKEALRLMNQHRTHWAEDTPKVLMAAVTAAYPGFHERLLRSKGDSLDLNYILALAYTGHADAIPMLRSLLWVRGQTFLHRPYLEWGPQFMIAPPPLTERDHGIQALAIAHHGTMAAAVAAYQNTLPDVPTDAQVPKNLLPDDAGEVWSITPYSLDKPPVFLVTPGATAGALVFVNDRIIDQIPANKQQKSLTVHSGIAHNPLAIDADHVPYWPFAPRISGIGLTPIDAPAQREGWRRYSAKVAVWYDALEEALPTE